MSYLMANLDSDPKQPSAAEIAAAQVAERSAEKRDIIAEWRVPTKGKLYVIEFEHGSTSGKRVLWIDGKEIFRRDWMFKLVGDEIFNLDDVRCLIRVDPASSFKFRYSLYVDGKPYEQYKERQAKALYTWEKMINEKNYRVVLEKDTLNIFLNGVMRDEEGQFVDDGTDTEFIENGHHFILQARHELVSRNGLVYKLKIDGVDIQVVNDE